MISQALAFAPSTTALIALLAVLPALFVFYVRYSFAARRIRPDLALRKLEALELQRAVLLYDKASRRIAEIYRQHESAGLSWRARRHSRAQFRQKFGEELEDLRAYTRDLRMRIVRLTGRPISRYRAWVHINSSRFALSRALAACGLIFALLAALVWSPEWGPALSTRFETFALWDSLEGRLLFANWIAVSVVAVVTPVLYVVQRTKLHRKHGTEIRQLREFAATDPDMLIGQFHGEEGPVEEWRPTGETLEDGTWFSVLGVSPTATIEEVKQAYKLRVKQNHPDRVHDMAPAIRTLAEAETKRLNVAYTEAMVLLRQRELIGPVA